MEKTKLPQKQGLEGIKFLEYEDKFFDQMISLYKTNLPRTHSPKGYEYLTRPMKDSGYLKVGALLLITFVINYGLLYRFVNMSIIASTYIGLIHFYCYVIGPRLFVKYQCCYCSCSQKRIFQRDTISHYFSGLNKFFIAVDIEKDLLVGMITYDTGFQNTLNLPVSESGEIARVSVQKEYGGRGIAYNLLKLVEEHAKKLNRKYLFLNGLSSNKRGIDLYQKFGFELQNLTIQRPSIFIMFGIHIFFMKKVIS